MEFRSAIVYFELVCEDYNIEEDANNGDLAAQNLLNNDRALLNQENLAINSLKKLFKKNISGEGHGSGGELVCKFGVNSVKELIDADRVLSRNHTGGDDEIDTGVAYFSARGFRFYPDGVNNGFYGEESRALGTWEEWIESQKGSRLAAVKRNAAMTPAHRFAAAYSTRRIASSLTAAEKFAQAYIQVLASKLRLELHGTSRQIGYFDIDETGNPDDRVVMSFFVHGDKIQVSVLSEFRTDLPDADFYLTLDFAKDVARIAANR